MQQGPRTLGWRWHARESTLGSASGTRPARDHCHRPRRRRSRPPTPPTPHRRRTDGAPTAHRPRTATHRPRYPLPSSLLSPSPSPEPQPGPNLPLSLRLFSSPSTSFTITQIPSNPYLSSFSTPFSPLSTSQIYPIQSFIFTF